MFIWYFNMSIKFRVSCRFFYAHDFSFTFRFGSIPAFFKARELVRVDFVIPKCLRNGSEKSNLEPLAVYLACAWNFRDWKTIDFISFPDFIFFFSFPEHSVAVNISVDSLASACFDPSQTEKLNKEKWFSFSCRKSCLTADKRSKAPFVLESASSCLFISKHSIFGTFFSDSALFPQHQFWTSCRFAALERVENAQHRPNRRREFHIPTNLRIEAAA